MNYRYYDGEDFRGKQAKHLHTIDGEPVIGASSVAGVVSKPFLVWWSAGKAVENMGWTNTTKAKAAERQATALPFLEKLQGMSVINYLKLLDESYKAHATNLKQTAQAGTDLHKILEDYIQDCIDTNGGKPKVADMYGFDTWAIANVEKFFVAEAYLASKELWVAGIVDAIALLKNGNIAVIDHKSSKEAYFTHFIQTALYALMLEENGAMRADGSQVLEKCRATELIITPFGTTPLAPAMELSAKYTEASKAAVVLYKAQQHYDRSPTND